MATAGRVVEEEELVEYIIVDLGQLVEYIIVGLGQEYDPIVSSIIARTTPVLISELYLQLLAFETRWALMNAHEGGGSSVNSASHDHGRSSSHGGFGRGGGHDTFFWREPWRLQSWW
jgi:uncharacterized membrane protein YgcG